MTIDPDFYASASHRNAFDNLSGPLRAGAVENIVRLTPQGRAVVDFPSREPLLLAAPKKSLNSETLRLEAAFLTPAPNQKIEPLIFAAYTESGAFLPFYRPPVDPQTRLAKNFRLALTLTLLAADGSAQAVPAAQIDAWIELSLLEGVMARTLYLLGAEKSHIRRQAREIAAMRLLAHGRDEALDRLGADLGVPRFGENLAFKLDQGKPALVTAARREPDGEYRSRLALYRGFQAASPRGVDVLLNGPGQPNDANAGLLGEIGFIPRFNIIEADNEFAVAIHLVETGAGSLRDHFLEHLRRNNLVLPADAPASNTIHTQRFLPTQVKERINQLRTRLRNAYKLPNAEAAFAPMLAEALDRLARCRQALGDASAWEIARAQDAKSSSRYELGLGCDLTPPAGNVLDAMAAVLSGGNLPKNLAPDVQSLLASMTPRPASEDPEGRWLLEPCGLRTIHRLDANTLYLSHFPTFGLVVNGGNQSPPETPLSLEARYHAPGDPGANVVLVSALAAVAPAWSATGKPAWSEQSDPQALALFNQAAGQVVPALTAQIFRAAGLPALSGQGQVVERLKLLPGELHQTILLDPAQSAAILSAQPGADLTAISADLRLLVGLFQEHGVVSILPLVTAPNTLALVLGAIGLPEAGINLSDRRAAGFYWYIVPLQGLPGQIKAIGSRTEYTPEKDGGLAAIVVVGYARRGLSDPYEYRLELPDEAVLSVHQYEFLMNMLERAYPIGIEINTFHIRRQHVDLDGDGKPEPLLPVVARTYRPFRRKRLRGEVDLS